LEKEVFMKKVSIILSVFLCFGLISPYLIVERAYAETQTQTTALDAKADLMFDEEFGVLDNDTAGRFYAGRDLYEGIHYISRGAMRFNLGDIPGTPIKYELKIFIIEKENHGGDDNFLDVWGSADNTMLDTDNMFPTWDTTKYVRKENNEINNNQPLTYDVTNMVESYTNASDRNITFVITGNEAAQDARFMGGLKEHKTLAYHPKLIVTYRINQPPTGSISINNGASYTNTTDATLNLTAVDPDSDEMEMRFSIDNTSWGNWESFSTTKDWTISTGDGVKTVYYQLRDTSKAVSAIANDTITLDTVKPVIIGVANGELYTNDKTITFNEGTGKLNGSLFVSGSTVSTDGSHTIIVTDEATNSTTVTFTIDKTAPTVTGVTNGKSYNTDRTVTFSEGTATLNGTAFISGTTITTEDDYTLIVTDTAGNSINIDFTIDKTNPEVTGVTEGGLYKTDKTITFNEGTAKLNGNTFTSGSTVNTEGSHTLIVTDSATNSTTINFSIDKTAPTVTGVINDTSYNTDLTVSFIEGTATLNGTAFVSGTTISTEDDYTLVVTDTAGNSINIDFTIDKTNPEVTGVTEGGLYKTDKTITFNEGTALLDGNPFTSGSSIRTEGSHTLIVTDSATNSITINFSIDKTAPVVTGVMNDTSYNTDLTVSFNEGSATLNGTAFISGTTITTEDDYTLVVTDAAGNSINIDFTIDKTNPEVTGVTEGGLYKTDKTITFIEGTAMLDGNPFASGSSVNTEGSHTIIVTDEAGNSITINFSIDKTAPVVTGVTNDTSYNTDLTVSFNEGTATLNGTAFGSGTTITREDDYTLIVTDTAGNSISIDFMIDKTNPIVNGVTEGGLYNTDKTITFNEGSALIDGTPFTSGSTVNTDGPHSIVVTDAATNSTTINFSIDKTDPVVTGVADGTSYNTDRTITFNEGTATLNGTALVSGTTITTEDDYTLIVTDTAGNSISIDFTIDKTNPLVTGVTEGGLYSSNKTITFNEGTAMLDGNPFTSGSTVNTDGPHSIVVTDAASNSTTVNFTIDKALANANLNNLIFSDGILTPVFSSNTLNYTMNVGVNVNKVTVTPTLDESRATLKVNDDSVASGSAVIIPIKVGVNTIKVEVTAKDGTIKSYTISVNRAHPPTPQPGPEKPTPPPTPKPKFSDVNEGDYFYEGVMSLATRKAISGYGDGTFRPNEIIRRDHAAKIIALALELDIENVENPGFKDVDVNHKYYGHIAALVNKGVINGYENKTFKPNSKITRAQMAKMIVKGFGFDEIKFANLPFTDVNDKQWFADYVQTLYSNEITAGTTATTFGPDTFITRGQLAAFIYRSEMKLALLK
jgi:hypothetical protein